jgi:putative membrane protein
MVRRTLMVATLIAGMIPMAFAQLSATDKSFLNKTARATNYEIQAAKLAQSMSTNDASKTYAQMMIDDHSQAAQQLGTAVSQADPSFKLPTDVSPAQQTQLDTLKNAKSDFDLKYRQQMIQSHAMLHSFFQDYLQGANNNASIKAIISNMQPIVQKHWDAAKKLPNQ